MRDKVIPFSRNISSKIGGASGLSLATASSDRARSPLRQVLRATTAIAGSSASRFPQTPSNG
jgi:hypothetical protein